jgi:hypothetical protein
MWFGLVKSCLEFCTLLNSAVKGDFVSVQADFAKLPAVFINDGTGTPSK